jgi:hypothetical protein
MIISLINIHIRRDEMANKPVKQDLRKVKNPTKGGKRTNPIKKGK